MGESFEIRKAELGDLQEIIRIWANGSQDALGKPIGDGNINYEDFFRQKVQSQDGIFQIWVAVDSDKSILGWQSLSPMTNNPAVRNYIAESSTYVCPKRRKEGVGKALVEYGLKHSKNTDLRYVMAFVRKGNEGVLKIADETGCQPIGTIPASPKSEVNDELIFITHVVPAIE
jgi:L-amino acid N-acyltransferase YncA